MITNSLLFTLNSAVGFIEHLPNSVLHISNVFTGEMILIYLILVSIMLLLYLKAKVFLYFALFLALMLSVRFTLTEITRQKQQKIIFYSTNKQSAIGFVNGKQLILLADSMLLKDKIALKFQLDGAKSLYGFSTTHNFALDTIADYHSSRKNMTALLHIGNNFIFQNKRVVLIDSLPNVRGKCAKLKVDFLVIRNNPKIQISNLQQLYQPECVIIDGTNSFYKTEKWMTEFKKAGLRAYSLKNSGAYIADL